jgi:hypothetical protein
MGVRIRAASLQANGIVSAGCGVHDRKSVACPNPMSSMQKEQAYGKKNLLILFDFETSLNYVYRLTAVLTCSICAKGILGW